MKRTPSMLALALAPFVAHAQAIVPYQPDVIKPPSEVGGIVYPRAAPTSVTFNLVAKEVVATIEGDPNDASAKRYLFWTFAEAGKKATVPGPLLRVMQGDTVTINITNLLGAFGTEGNQEPHNIDFHAAMGPGGGAAVTNVEPGQTATVTFKATRAGAYIYHCAGEGFPWEHVAHGMYGAIIVEPPGGLPPVDREYYVGQAEWYLGPVVGKSDADNVTGGVWDYHNLDGALAEDERPNIYTFNGHKTALAANALRARQGDRVRIFFVNGGPNKISNFHLIGQIFDKVAVGLPRPTQMQMNEETMAVTPGSAAMFEMDTLVPGKYLVVDHALFRVPKGAGGLLVVDPLVPGVWPTKLFSPPAW